MKKFLNALNRLAGLSVLLVFASAEVWTWRMFGPLGEVTKEIGGAAGAVVFVIITIFNGSLTGVYCHVMSKTKFKLTIGVMSVAHTIITSLAGMFRRMFNWLTAD